MTICLRIINEFKCYLPIDCYVGFGDLEFQMPFKLKLAEPSNTNQPSKCLS